MVEREKSKWWQLIWSVFVGFLFLAPIQRHASRLEWGMTVLGVLVFLALYVVAIAFWSNRTSLAAIAGITLLGVAFAPTNPGACLFFIYAASFVPFALGGKAGASALLIGAILAIVGVESWLLSLHWHFWAYAVGYSVIIGIGNTWAAQKSFTIERLAQIAERERIARDLHDVLGHTLSVIILKAELAGKLLDRDRELGIRRVRVRD
jgi:two-component system, NarL family, sensor histidine kinase DesK